MIAVRDIELSAKVRRRSGAAFPHNFHIKPEQAQEWATTY